MGVRVKAFEERLREARDAADLTQEELARQFGVSTRTLQNWEAGRGTPLAKHRRALNHFLGEQAA